MSIEIKWIIISSIVATVITSLANTIRDKIAVDNGYIEILGKVYLLVDVSTIKSIVKVERDDEE